MGGAASRLVLVLVLALALAIVFALEEPDALVLPELLPLATGAASPL